MLISVNSTFCQGIKADTVIKANYSTYNTKTIGSGNSANIFVVNSNNIYYNKKPRNRNIDMVVLLNNKSGFINALKQVFGDERLRQLIPERFLRFTLYVNPNGQIMEMAFLLDKNTSITATELEALEKAIKAQVSFKFRREDINGQNFVDISEAVSYKMVLDGTLK